MKKAGLLFLTVLLIAIAGCGGGSSSGLALTGSLTNETSLVAGSSGYYNVVTTAVYKHPTKDSTGVPLNFAIIARTASGNIIYSDMFTEKQTSGGLIITWGPFLQATGPIFVTVGVTAGDLKDFRSVEIPGAGNLTSSPTFVNMSGLLSQEITVSGAGSPYTIYSSPLGVNFSPTTGTGTFTISEATFLKLNGAILVESSTGDRLAIYLRY